MKTRLTLIALIVATLVAYVPVRSAGFVYEDEVYLSFAKRALTLTDVLQPRGLTIASFGLNGWWGATPQGYHAVNMGLHLILGLTVFGFARTLLPVPYALTAAGLTLLHPIQTEAVAYVSGRAELIAAIGTVAAVWALSGPATWTRAGLAFLATVVAIGGKEMGLMAMPLIALYALVIRRVHLLAWRTVGWALAGLGAGVALALPILQVRVIGAIEYIMATEQGWLGYAGLQSYALLVLLGNAIVPLWLTVDHDYDGLSRTGMLVALGVLLMGLLAAWLVRRRVPVVTFGLWWVVIALAPRFVVRISELLNEHQVYTAFIGLWIAASAGLMHLNAFLTRSPKETVCCSVSSPVSSSSV